MLVSFSKGHVAWGKKKKAQTGFEPVIFGLRDRRLTTWPLRRW